MCGVKVNLCCTKLQNLYHCNVFAGQALHTLWSLAQICINLRFQMISYRNWLLASNCQREFAVVLGGTYGVPRYTVHVGRWDIVDFLVHLVFLLILLYFVGKWLRILHCFGRGAI